MKFKFSHADNDVWMKKDMRPDGTVYYSYILVYTDDILIVSQDPKRYMDQLEASYYVKKESIKFPDIYLSSRVKRFMTDLVVLPMLLVAMTMSVKP